MVYRYTHDSMTAQDPKLLKPISYGTQDPFLGASHDQTRAILFTPEARWPFGCSARFKKSDRWAKTMLESSFEMTHHILVLVRLQVMTWYDHAMHDSCKHTHPWAILILPAAHKSLRSSMTIRSKNMGIRTSTTWEGTTDRVDSDVTGPASRPTGRPVSSSRSDG